MRRYLIPYWALIACAAAMCCSISSARAELTIGDKPEIAWKGLDNKDVTGNSLMGWIVVVHFWETADDWTPENIDKLHDLRAAYGLRGVRLVGVCLDRRMDIAKRAAKELKMTWSQVCDGKGFQSPIAQQWSIVKMPQAFVLDPVGNLAWRGHPSALDTAIEKSLAATPPKLTKQEQMTLTQEALREAVRSLEEQLIARRQAGSDANALNYNRALMLMESVPLELLSDRAFLPVAKGLVPLFDSPVEKDRLAITPLWPAYPRSAKALAMLKEMMKVASSQPAASQPRDSDRRAQLAEQRLKSADEAAAAGRHGDALRNYRQLAERWTDTPAGRTAVTRVAAYEKDPALIAKAKEADIENEAKALMATAKGYADADRADLAKQAYQQVIEKYPGTPWAKEAASAAAALP